jgi:hypothetical protein
MFNYALINQQNIVIGISSHPEQITNEFMIEVEDYDLSLIGKKYINSNFEDNNDI